MEAVKEGKKELLIKEVRHLTNNTYVLSLERNGLEFIPGQYMTLGQVDSKEMREYSIYSGVNNNRLEFLIKEVEEGDVSKQLKYLKPGDFVAIDGPFGFFTINKEHIKHKKHLFIASGTGISPFHSFAQSFEGMDYLLIHGVRGANESYEKEDYPKGRYISCSSRDSKGHFHGRVTDYLKKHPVDKETLCYLCGNSNMIYDAFDILRNQGIPSGNVHMEVYF
jgi:ferredoxin/flavodoxin---NADP+ reductase